MDLPGQFSAQLNIVIPECVKASAGRFHALSLSGKVNFQKEGGGRAGAAHPPPGFTNAAGETVACLQPGPVTVPPAWIAPCRPELRPALAVAVEGRGDSAVRAACKLANVKSDNRI